MQTAFEEKRSFPSVPESIIEVESIAEQLRMKLNIPEEVYGNILISVTEAANNAIIHGNACKPEKMFQLYYKYLPESNLISFKVKDSGPGFDYNQLPDPTAPENLDKVSGRGVFLMKQLADLVVFDDSGSEVELQFKL